MTALTWHGFVWDPWFLIWGLLGMATLILAHEDFDLIEGTPDRVGH